MKRIDCSSLEYESIQYLHRDHLGSVEAISDEQGALIRDLGFDPIGERKTPDWARQLNEQEKGDLIAASRSSTTRGSRGTNTSIAPVWRT